MARGEREGLHQTSSHEQTQPDLDLIGDLQAPEEHHGVDGQKDIADRGPGLSEKNMVSFHNVLALNTNISQKLTALKIRHVIGPLDMMAGPRKLLIPQLRHRIALQQDQDHLIDVDDDVAESDEVQDPNEDRVLHAVRPVLDAQEKGNDCDLAESDGLDGDDLSDPTPQIRLDQLRAEEQIYVIAQA